MKTEKKNQKSEMEKKREGINENIEVLNRKKVILESHRREAVQFAFEADETNNWELLSEPNDFKISANEKQEDLDKCLKAKHMLIERKQTFV